MSRSPKFDDGYEKDIAQILARFPNNLAPGDFSSILTSAFIRWLSEHIQSIFEAESNVINVESKVHIVGDIHGQFDDLISLFRIGGIPPQQKYLFLGDYVDRGKHSVEVICLLFMLKYKYPDSIFLLRGNHESRETTKVFGFTNECTAKLGKHSPRYFYSAFDKLPLCAIVDGTYFCVHAGLSPELNLIDDINSIDRFCEIPEKGLFADLLWSDPSQRIEEWTKSNRDAETFFWGLEPVKRFLESNNLTHIIRGHQIVNNGYQYPFEPDESVVTVYSSNNSSNMKNKATFLTIDGYNPFTFTEIPVIRFPPRSKNATVEDPTTNKKKKKK